MAETRRNINYTSLDFDDIKEKLINYIKTDKSGLFSGANFEGSGLNLLSDLLAYVTHMTAVTANMSANEMFMDSAQLRQSIVSKAKELGYRPISIRTPVAKLQLIFTESNNPNRESVTIDEGTRFITTSGAVFSTKEEWKAYPIETTDTNVRIFEAIIDVYEGIHVKYRYVADLTNPDQRFYISSDKADMSTLQVLVRPYNTSDLEIYKENDNLNVLTPESKVYFLHQNPDNYYEVVFGDGILGKKINDGDEIILSYIVSDKGTEANGIDHFEKAEVIDGFQSYAIRTIEKAKDGYEQETGDQIRYRASRMWKAQNRAVVKEDYEALLLKEYPWIDSVSIWGGQYNNPPTYGKIFFAIKPKHTDILAYNLKEKIKEDMIKKYNVVTVIPEIIDPDYIWVGVKSDVIYRKTKTIRSADDIAKSILENIIDYFKSTVENFGMIYYLSPMTALINATDNSIVSSKSTIFLSKRIYPKTRSEERFVQNFANTLVPGTFRSSNFNVGDASVYVTSYLKDDNEGNIHVYAKESSDGKPIIYNVGNIDYEKGTVDVLFTPYAVPDTKNINFYAEPVDENVYQENKQIIMKDTSIKDDFWGIRSGTVINMIPAPLTEK